MPEPQSFQRQVAYKVRISDILDASLNKEGFLNVTINGYSVSRVSIISALVYKSEDAGYASGIIDDGTGRISLRNFEKKDVFSKIDIGDIILVIGKIREFSNERYIVPEIVKTINNPDWVKVRKAEVQGNVLGLDDSKKEPDENTSAVDEVFSLIRKLDSGDGVLIDDVVREYKNNDAEETLKTMMKNGDIFEIKPGKIKILE